MQRHNHPKQKLERIVNQPETKKGKNPGPGLARIQSSCTKTWEAFNQPEAKQKLIKPRPCEDTITLHKTWAAFNQPKTKTKLIKLRPCEDTITLTAEWENYPAREGGKTTKGEEAAKGKWFGFDQDEDEDYDVWLSLFIWSAMNKLAMMQVTTPLKRELWCS